MIYFLLSVIFKNVCALVDQHLKFQQLLESTTAETLNVDELSGGACILEITTKENKIIHRKIY